MNKHVVELTTENFDKEVINTDFEGKVLVDFWAPWCGPCRQLGPIIDELAEFHKVHGHHVHHEHHQHLNVKFCKINVDEQGDLAARYKISSIPAVLIFQKGRQVDSFVGLKSKEDIEHFLRK